MKLLGIDTEDGANLVAALALAVLTYSVLRGLVPLLTGDANLARPAYFAAAIFGMALSSYGLYVALFTNSKVIGEWPQRLLIINGMLYTAWLIPVLIFNPDFQFEIIVHSALFPFAVYALIRIPTKTLSLVLGFLTLLVSAFVIREFIELNTSLIPDGYRLAFERQSLLRPGLFEGFTRTGDVFRPNGPFGFRPHDSGNILAILYVYWLAMLFNAGKSVFSMSAIAIIALVALLCTQSAANIVAACAGTVFVLIAALRCSSWRSRSFWTPMFIFFLILTVVMWVLSSYDARLVEMLWTWSERISIANGDWKGMTAIGRGDLVGDAAAVLFGHGSSLQVSRIGDVTEIGFLKSMVEYGLIHSLVFHALLFYPVALFFSGKFRESRLKGLPYVAAVAVGFLSLWHYGSLIRTTNIFVFLALYAQALYIFNRPAGAVEKWREEA